jgi:hypothetical protein
MKWYMIPLPPQVVYICKPTLVERRVEPKPCLLVKLACNPDGECRSELLEAPVLKIPELEKEE